jgi:hypothetical protein
MYRLRTALLICFIGLTLFSGLSIILVGFTISKRGRIDFAEIGGHFLTQSISAKVENILQDVEDIVEMTERFSFKIENGKVDYRLLLNNLASSLMINHNLGTVIYTEEKTGYTLSAKTIGGAAAVSPYFVPYAGLGLYVSENVNLSSS